MQTIVNEYPPNILEINGEFHTVGDRVIYSYGSVIYNPMGEFIPPQLVAHEGVHGTRQEQFDVPMGNEQPLIPGDTPMAAWWRVYLMNRRFRLAEETLAHRAEYRYLRTHGTRHQRRSALSTVSQRLASNLYGGLVKKSQARDLIDMSDYELGIIMRGLI